MFLTYYALFQFRDMMKSYYCSYVYIKCVLIGCLFSQFLYLKITAMTITYNYYNTIFKTTSNSKLFSEIFLYWNSSCILRKLKFDSLVYTILKSLLGCMIIDHSALTTTRKVKFLLFALLIMIVLCLENCSFYTLDWYEEALRGINVLWGDLAMISDSNFNVHLCQWKIFYLKIVEALLFLLRFLSLVFYFNWILLKVFLFLYSKVF